MAVGTATANFGAHPGATEVVVAVPGQTGILATSYIEAWLRMEATTEHSVDELEAIKDNIEVVADESSIVTATGFNIIVRPRRGYLYGNIKVNWGGNYT